MTATRQPWDKLAERRRTLNSPRKKRAADRLLNYVSERRDMISYPEFRAKGWQIGSGPTESRCKTSTFRLKGRGRRWNHRNAEAVAALTTFMTATNGVSTGKLLQPSKLNAAKIRGHTPLGEARMAGLSLTVSYGIMFALKRTESKHKGKVTMAKKLDRGAKTAAIRELLAAYPDKGPTELAELVKQEKGIPVSAQDVSNVKTTTKARKKVRKGKRKMKAAAGATAHGLGAAVEFIKAAGGIEAAKAAISTVEEIKNL